MNQGSAPLRIAIVAGEESGDLLGADLVRALARQSGRPVELVGVGGRHLHQLGLRSLFDPAEIAIMGFSAVLQSLPRLMMRIRQTAKAIAAAKPDCLITIDVPDFSLRVARRVRADAPDVPTVHYVCPSVWAWRPGRAIEMRPYVDHILCLLPFEPDELDRLGGPAGTFVGHRLASDPAIRDAALSQLGGGNRGGVRKLLLLPGSRRGEVSRLLPVFGETVRALKSAGHAFQVQIPTVPHVAQLVMDATESWAVKPEVILDEARKWKAFGEADAALACSGTVALELALARVPFISVYRTDFIARLLGPLLIKVWSASLPNLIAGWPVVPEYFNQYVRPELLARLLPRLWSDTPTRLAQRQGFAQVAEALSTSTPSGELAAKVVLDLVRRRAGARTSPEPLRKA